MHFRRFSQTLLSSIDLSTQNARPTRRPVGQRGQGLIEYLIIVALMAVATIGIVRVLSQTVAAKFATATHALQGQKKSVRAESVDESHHRKKDLGDFMNGVGGGNDNGQR